MKTAHSHLTETIYNLEPDAKLELFKVTLSDNPGTQLFFSKDQELTWLGNEYASVPCNLSGVEQKADGSRARPRFSFANPGGVFTSYIIGNFLEGGTLERMQVMASDVESNSDISMRQEFRITKILSVNKNMCAVELKGALDGHSFQLPARAFYPPEFPHVSL